MFMSDPKPPILHQSLQYAEYNVGLYPKLLEQQPPIDYSKVQKERHDHIATKATATETWYPYPTSVGQPLL
jgi:hypothetical protein